MRVPRSPASILVLLLLAASAAGDVIILVENDVPLSGTILGETETSVRFRIRGLSEGSFVEIRKDRIKTSWRDAPESMREVRPEPPPRPRAAAVAPVEVPRRSTSPPPPRTADQIRESHLDELRERLLELAPGLTTAGALTAVLGLAFGVVLLWVGGRLADMDELGLPQAALLSLLTVTLVAAAPPAFDLLPGGRARLGALAGAIVLWILFVRVVIHESVRKGILLLSFFVLGSGLVGLLGFSILSVM